MAVAVAVAVARLSGAAAHRRLPVRRRVDPDVPENGQIAAPFEHIDARRVDRRDDPTRPLPARECGNDGPPGHVEPAPFPEYAQVCPAGAGPLERRQAAATSTYSTRLDGMGMSKPSSRKPSR